MPWVAGVTERSDERCGLGPIRQSADIHRVPVREAACLDAQSFARRVLEHNAGRGACCDVDHSRRALRAQRDATPLIDDPSGKHVLDRR
jgi:hypothetical protein